MTPDLDVGKLVLSPTGKGRSLQVQVQNSITDGELERTTDGASTLSLTVHDPKLVLLQSGIFSFAIDVQLDTHAFRLTQVSKRDTDLQLTFEDKEVARLRGPRGPKKAARSKMTRAEFALSLVRELTPPIPFVCPQLHNRQPIAATAAPPKDKTTTTTASTTVVPTNGVYGFAQLESLWITAGGARSVAPTMAAIALAESSGKATAVGGPNTNGTYDYGCWQINSVHGYDRSRLLATDQSFNAQCAVSIYNGQGLSAWSTYTSGAYKRYLQSGSAATVGVYDTRTARRTLPYQYRRGTTDGKKETSWQCLQRLAQEVNWRCYVNEGTVYFVSDDDLLKLAPVATVEPTDPAVVGCDFDIDNGKVKSTVQLTVRASRWGIDPGAVMVLKGYGPADGSWIVHTVRRGLYDANTSVELRRATAPLKEPAAETKTVTTRTKRTVGGVTVEASMGSGTNVETAYEAALGIDAKRYPYVWGGGHGIAGVPNGGGYDCSGSVSAVLAAAEFGMRLGGPSMTSGPLMSWGQAGRGTYLTVYTNPIHAFIVFHTKRGDQHFGTGRWGKSWGGAGFNPTMHPTDGFTARHWPGT